jgi:uncharacterized Zn-binding protein involved in type VI secretion
MASVCTLGDLAITTAPHEHNCPSCPHVCQGPAISASANVRVSGKPALRVGDMGIHSSCCGPNTWLVQEGSGQLFINGSAAVRVGDKTRHCSISKGKMVTGSANVADGSGAGGPFGALVPPFNVQVEGPPLNPLYNLSDEARAMLPCDDPRYLPPGGRPEQPQAKPILDPEAYERQRVERLRLAQALGYDVDDQLSEEERLAKAQLDQARSMVNESVESGNKLLEVREANLRRAEEHFRMIQQARGGAGGAARRGGGPRGR